MFKTVVLISATSLLLTVSVASAATYSYTTLQFPGAQGTYPVSINKFGTVAGYFFDSGYTGHGFTYTNGVFTQVDGGGTCGGSFVTGINDLGVLAGYCFPSEGGTRSFIDNNGVFTYYTLSGVLDSYTEGINNKNATVGWYFTNFGTILSFHTSDGANIKTFVAPGSNATLAFGINNRNVVVGNGVPANAAHQQGFVAQNGKFTFTIYPGSYETFFNGVNDLLQVVGDENKVADGPVAAFIYQGGKFTDLLVPNAASSVAAGINNPGVIVGYYVTGSALLSVNASGFIATPQP